MGILSKLFSGGAAATANIWKAVEWTLSDGSNTSTISNGNTVTFSKGNGFSNILAEFVRLYFVEFKLFFIAKQYFERFLSSKLVGY